MTGFLTTQLPIRQWTLQTVAAHQLIIPRHHRASAADCSTAGFFCGQITMIKLLHT